MSSSASLERGEKGSGHIWNIGFYAPFFGQGPKHFSRTGIVISKKIPSFLKQNASFAIREKKIWAHATLRVLIFLTLFFDGVKMRRQPSISSPFFFRSKRPPYNFPRFPVKLEIPCYNKEILLFCLPPHPPVWTITQQKKPLLFPCLLGPTDFSRKKKLLYFKKAKTLHFDGEKNPWHVFCPPLSPSSFSPHFYLPFEIWEGDVGGVTRKREGKRISFNTSREGVRSFSSS